MPCPEYRHYAVDSGAFAEVQRHGRFLTSPAEYVEALARYDKEIGDLAWAVPQDWMCEPPVIWSRPDTRRSHLRLCLVDEVRKADVGGAKAPSSWSGTVTQALSAGAAWPYSEVVAPERHGGLRRPVFGALGPRFFELLADVVEQVGAVVDDVAAPD